MPLVFDKEVLQGVKLGIWNVDEHYEELLSVYINNGGAGEEINEITHESRRKQIICERVLTARVLGIKMAEIRYENQVPVLSNIPVKISISHSGDMIAVMASQVKDIGIDIERISGRIEKIAPRFLHPEEQKMLAGENRIEQLLMMWCAKEALFKLYKKGGLDFKENIRIKTFDKNLPGRFSGIVQKRDDKLRCSLYSMRFEGYIIVYAVNE